MAEIRSIDPGHIYELTTVGNPSISPDGTQVVFSKSRLDHDSMKARSRLVMATLPEGGQRVFSRGDSDGSPEFSPDGSQIAFIRPDKDGNRQLWLIPLDFGEAYQLTDVLGGIGDYAWSPDGLSIAFVSDTCKPEDIKNGNVEPYSRVVTSIRYRNDQDGWRGDSFYHIFVVDVATRGIRQITDGNADDIAPIWSPDGSRIAFVSDRNQDRDSSWQAGVYVFTLENEKTTRWTEGVSCFSQNPLSGALAWSPDGTRLAIVGTDDPDLGDPRQAALFIASMGGVPVKLTDGFHTPVLVNNISPNSGIRWTEQDRIILVLDHRGESYLCEVSVSDRSLKIIVGGGVQLTAITVDRSASRAVFVSTPAQSSGDLYLVDLHAGSQIQLTRFNDSYFSGHPPGPMEKFSVKRGAIEIESRLIVPPGFDQANQYPLVVDVHGGPQGRFMDSFDPRQQVLATAGYLVLAVNPRGSTSYGLSFAKSVLGDWGGEDYLDIMKALDEVCLRDYVDETRLGIHGYSYGGFMSAWAVGHTDRFRAAVVGAPVVNLVSMYGTSDIGVSFGEPQWGGQLVDAFDAFVEHSPLMYAANVETPVLLLHGESDHRCPISQSEEFFVSLKRLGKTVEFVRFPGCNHGFVRGGHPKMREEYFTRMKDWFDKYLMY